MGWWKDRSRRNLATRLKEQVESGTARSRITALSIAGAPAEDFGTTVPIPAGYVLSWGHALEHEVIPELGPNSTHVIYVLTETGIVYQVLPEVPPQMRSLRARAAGSGPGEWKEMAAESTTHIPFEAVDEGRVGEATNGSWQLFFLPRRATSESDLVGLGITESYGGLSPREVGEFVAGKLGIQAEPEAWR